MKGILPSLNTPFTNSGELDLDSLTRLVEHTIISGCGGMLGVAVAGEHNTLNFDEKIQFIETVTKVNKRRIPFICSVTAADFNESVELTKIANSFGAKTTPHIFMFNNELQLIYKGAIDDNYKDINKVKKFYLKDAIEQLSSGEKIKVNETEPVGCSIKRFKP